jgi:ketosteroid isomerase-like protein
MWDEIRKNVMRGSATQFLVIIALLLSVAAGGVKSGQEAGLQSLVQAEMDFARMSAERGWVQAFIANFADDGVNFTPHPTRTKERLSSQPPSDSGPKNTLHWRPVYSDISAAGDMGYNTGPFWVEDEKKQIKPQGYFFSVWKKQRDGSWKVILDIGVGMPLTEPDLAVEWKRSTSLGYTRDKADGAATQKDAVTRLEQTASARGMEKILDPDTRLHTPKEMPILGKEAVLAHWKNGAVESIAWQPLVVEAAQSADLAYSYGSYTVARAGSETERGYYGHVWKRDPRGEWRLAMEVINPLPKEKK